MLEQARELSGWIPNAHIKFPTNPEGLDAARQAVTEGLRVNMTLCFQQEQAAAVYAGTAGARPGDVFVSPFVGRLDDRGENGMDLIANILRMFEGSDGHVQVLTASVRTMEHLLCSLQLGTNIVTAPFRILRQWALDGLPLPDRNFEYPVEGLKPLEYREIDLNRPWREYDVFHDLTDAGMDRISHDWNALIG